MADVQIENGYTRIANALLEALIQYKFSETEYTLLFLIIRMSYGCGKKTASFRNWIEISKLSGVDRQNIKPTLEYLQAAHVVFVDWENIVMGCNKNYDHWHIEKKHFVAPDLMKRVIEKNLHCNDTITNVNTELQMSLPDNTDIISTLSKSNYVITKNGEIVITQLQLVMGPLQTQDLNPHENKYLGTPKESKEIYKERSLSGPNRDINTGSKEFATLNNEVQEIIKKIKPCN